MPTISILKQEFFKQLGTTLAPNEFDDLCFEFGIEYDGTEINESGQEVLKIEIPANRYDLLCTEGLVCALLSYRWNANPPSFSLSPKTPAEYSKITVSKECASLRPYIFSAILRNVKITEENYKSLIDLQEKLHQNICRNRVLAAVGTHDLDTIKPPFTYSFEPPETIIFAPLTDGTREYNCVELMKVYETHPQLKAYTKILAGAPLHPVVRDSTGTVCSYPPIINSYKSRVTLDTRNIFIEVTATDKIKGSIVLNQIIACFSKYCEEPYTIEPVLIQYDDEKHVTPDLSQRVVNASVNYISSLIGVEDLTAKSVSSLLYKMMIPSNVIDDDTLEAFIPITRSDIQHQCDLGEDVAIAYGYNNIRKRAFHMGKLREKTLLSNRARSALTNCGYKETLMPVLDSFKSAYHNMCWRIPSDDEIRSPVSIHNSQIAEQELLRTSLIPGLLKTVFNRKASVLPIRIYEIGDVVWKQKDSELGAVNNSNCAVAYANVTTAGLEEIQGISEFLLNTLGFVSEYQVWELSQSNTPMPESYKFRYKLEELDDPAFLPGRHVSFVMSSEPFLKIGIMGIIHPNVLRNCHITMPVSAFELDLTLLRKIITNEVNRSYHI